MRTRLFAALLLAAVGIAGVAKAEGGGIITGKVEATPAKYLEDTVVYLRALPGTYPSQKRVMDQQGMKFVPHVLVVTQGDTVTFLNHDKVDHNVYSPDGEGYNLGNFKQGENASYTFKKTGVYSQLCSVHPEMLAFIFVGQNPYASVVDAKGNFTIKDVPPGTWQLEVWNADKLKATEKTVTVVAGQTVTESLSVKR